MGILDRPLSRRGLLAGTSAAAGAITLSACGSDADADAGFVMTVWGGDTDRTTYQARIDALVAAQTDQAVTLQLIPSDSYAQKVQTMIAGGDGPDIMEVAETVNVYSSKSQILALDDLASAAGVDLVQRFGETVADIYRYQDATYAIPDRSGAAIVYYNKAMFDAKGIAYPSADWTWDDALAAFQELTVPGKVWGYGGASWWPIWWSFVYQNGGAIIDTETGLPTVDSDEVVEALQWAGDLVNKWGVVPTTAETADLGDGNLIAKGNLACGTTGFWDISALQAVDGLDWDIAPLWQGKQRAVSAFGSGLAISRDCPDPEKAMRAIAFLTDVEAQTIIIDQEQDCPANLEVQQGEAFTAPSWDTAGINMGALAESADAVFRAPFIPEWTEMQDAMSNGLADFWLGEQDAASALAAVQEKLLTIITPADS